MSKGRVFVGWVLFVFAMGFFGIQMGYLVFHQKYRVEYIDDRMLFLLNILCIICLAIALKLLMTIPKKWIRVGAALVAVFVLVNATMLMGNGRENITSISPDFSHVLSIKVNKETGDAVYYRSYLGIFGRAKDRLPHKIPGDYKIEWLADDIGAVTYSTTGNKLQQFIATYGDRGGGSRYYYVGAEIHGQWAGKDARILAEQKGISVTYKGQTELFDWEQVVQFGTLAFVLMKDGEASWTIALNEDFKVLPDSSLPQTGTISLYKATMEDVKPVVLHHQGGKED